MASVFHTQEDDIPYVISNIYQDLNLPFENTPLSQKLLPKGNSELKEESHSADSWANNYHEAAIYLQEGDNNEKLDLHPSSKRALPAYFLVHNTWYYIIDLIAAVVLIGLALFENPTDVFLVGPAIHASLELFLLVVMLLQLIMKLRWMSTKHFFHHQRTVIKFVVVIVMFAEALAVLIRQSSHFRVTRMLRPVFLIDNHYCKGIRRVVRQIFQSLPPILDMLTLLFFFLFIFSIVGFNLAWNYSNNEYFNSFLDSIINLFIMMTTANFPDVMMPSFDYSRWHTLFFIVFGVLQLYMMMNLLLAVVYSAFTKKEKVKFLKLFKHRKNACQRAFDLLVTKSNPTVMKFVQFEGLMSYYRSNISRLDIYLLFKTMDTDNSGTITLNEFNQVFEVSPLHWKVVDKRQWYSNIRQPFKSVFNAINLIAKSKILEVLIYSLILVTGVVYMLVDKISASNINSVSILFVSIYLVEAFIKYVGLGPFGYFSDKWNRFDFVILMIGLMGISTQYILKPFSFVIVFRLLRFLKLFKMKKSFKDILGTMYVILPRFASVAIVIFMLFYSYAILGMELFGGIDLINCCKNTSVEIYYESGKGLYHLNNFNDFISSGITLFELMMVNNWFITMDAYSIVTTRWNMLYFISFYLLTLVVINIVIAFVLEAFLFRMNYIEKMGDMDKDSLVRCYVELSPQEMGTYALFRPPNNESVLFRGTRTRTKFSFCLKMYADEIKESLHQEVLPTLPFSQSDGDLPRMANIATVSGI